MTAYSVQETTCYFDKTKIQHGILSSKTLQITSQDIIAGFVEITKFLPKENHFKMKYFVTEASIIFLLCFVELFKVVSSDRMDIIDNFIGLAEPNNNEIEKRNSIVDGGVFVPYKSTTIVHKSRLVPVTYGFVIKKETLKDNPALYKLGVKLLDEKVESTPKHIKLDGKTVEQAKILTEKLNDQQQQLEAKSNCVKGSKVLRLLAKLSKGKDVLCFNRDLTI